MTRVLLITGARSLADSPDAERWARALIAEALAGCELLIVGDARGPDEWAWTIAGNIVVNCDEYVTGGPNAGKIAEHRGIGAPRIDRRWAWHGTTRPLARNAVMVSDAEKLRIDGHDVRVLALLDGTKRDEPGRRVTRGTEHTAGLAERAGLSVRREVWNG